MITIEVQEDKNPFLNREKIASLQQLGTLDSKKIKKLEQLANCDLSDEVMDRLLQLAKSPVAANLLIDNWEFIKSMM